MVAVVCETDAPAAMGPRLREDDNLLCRAGHSTFLIQLCGSAARPYWMSISVLRSPIATAPAAPPLMRKSPLAEHTLPIGEITAAVPQAKASFSFPEAASARHWSIV